MFKKNKQEGGLELFLCHPHAVIGVIMKFVILLLDHRRAKMGIIICDLNILKLCHSTRNRPN